jgi:hypothetical protein
LLGLPPVVLIVVEAAGRQARVQGLDRLDRGFEAALDLLDATQGRNSRG